MKHCIALSAIFVLSFIRTCPASSDSIRVAQLPTLQRAQAAHPAVARVSVQERDAISQGSGSLVEVRGDRGIVITNWHVVRDASGPISVRFPNGFTSPAQLLKTDKDWDLAALLIWNPGIAPIRVSNRPSQLGEPLMIAGYGSGQYRAVAGRCTQYVAPGRNMPYEMLEVSVQARQGDSGGPILNQRGELAGVLFGSGRGTTSGSYAGRVGRFLQDAWPGIPDTAPQTPDRIQVAQSELQAPRAIEVPKVAPQVAAIVERPQPEFTSTKPTVPFRSNDTPPLNPLADSSPSNISLDPPQQPRSLWQSVAGMTIGEQIKSVLAMIGACAVVLQLLGFNSKPE